MTRDHLGIRSIIPEGHLGESELASIAVLRVCLPALAASALEEPATVKSDKEWRYWGTVDPLWAVASWDGKNLGGPSPWSVGEREMFAAFVSRLNQCVF